MNSIHRISQCAIARTFGQGTKSLRLAIAPSGYGNERSHQTTSVPGKRFGFTRSSPLIMIPRVGCRLCFTKHTPAETEELPLSFPGIEIRSLRVVGCLFIRTFSPGPGLVAFG